jgi:mannan endo-1,4-beta-mannosidase
MRIKTIAAIFFAATISVFAAETPFQNFITTRGDQLFDGDQPFRFISFNIPNLLLIEDNYPFAETNAWRLPDQFEITDALATVQQMGGTVVRTYSITVARGENPPAQVSMVLAPGKFNEEPFVILDRALQTANEQGVRLVIPLVNNWPWMGGRPQYAAFRGKGQNDFWTDPQIIADFEQTIKYVLTRTNTLTGVRYCDDKAILCWETGNELQSPAAWTREIAAT